MRVPDYCPLSVLPLYREIKPLNYLMIMTAINRTDLLYVTAIKGGATIFSTCLSGVASLGEVFRKIKSATQSEGILTLRLRNSTQGWVQSHNLIFKSENLQPAFACHGQNSNSKVKMDYPSLF